MVPKKKEIHKCVQPNRAENHGLFGLRYFKRHLAQDPKWIPVNKTDQYKGMITINSKSQYLSNLRAAADRNQRHADLKQLRKDIVKCYKQSKIANFGDLQRLVNILSNNEELKRNYRRLPVDLVAEKIDKGSFQQRKQLDELVFLRKQLTEKYKESVLQLAQLQDRIHYFENPEQLKENIECKKKRMQIKSSETRLRLAKIINTSMKQIISLMLNDSIYFDPIFDALKSDVKEQEDFIDSTIQLGKPALSNVKELVEEYQLLQRKTSTEYEEHLDEINSLNNQIKKNNQKMKELTRRNSDFFLDLKRYNRHTASMQGLQVTLNGLRNIITELKITTSCAYCSEIYPCVKKQIHDKECLEQQVARRDVEVDCVLDQNQNAQVMLESVVHNLTEEEQSRLKQITELKANIRELMQESRRHKKYIKEKGEVVCLIRSSFQHIVEILRHVGNESMRPKKLTEYSNEDLTLPLLHFDAIISTRPPKILEWNAEKLQENVIDKVKILMSVHGQLTEEKYNLASRELHDDMITNLYYDEEKPERRTVEAENVNPLSDPNVPNRRELKSNSIKIVEEARRLAQMM